MPISEGFIKRKNTTIVVAIILVILGIISIISLPIAQMPDITPPIVSVRSNYIGANAKTVENTVTTPIEEQINGVPGEMYMSSTSANDGSSSITVTFQVGTDPDIATVDVQNRVSQALPIVPSQVTRTGVSVVKRSNDVLMLIGLKSPKNTHSNTFLNNYLNIFIVPEIARVPGVGQAFSFGQDYSMRIWLNPQKMAALGLTANQVVQAIQDQNQQVPAGTVGSSPALPSQSFEYNITVNGQLETPEQFGNIIVASDPSNGSLVKLKDVAKIQLGTFSYSTEHVVDGVNGTGMAVYLAPGANALQTADLVEAKMNQLAKSFPPDLEWVMPFQTAPFVRMSIREVVITLLIALILVAFVVFIFLENWRATIIPILVIPVSLIGAFLFLNLFGFSINTLTLFGFVLAIGIVVDDAIVVVEATQRNIDVSKLQPREATLQAMKEVQAPIIAMSLILAAVFIPAAFIPGVSGRLYQQFALTIAFSVILSAFLALTLTPVLCTLLLRPEEFNKSSKGINWFFYHFSSWFNKVTEHYNKGVRNAIRKTYVVAIVLILIFAFTFYLFRTVPTTFVPQEDMGSLIIAAVLPEGSSLGRTEVVTHQVSKILRDDSSAVSHFFGLSGLNFAGGGAQEPNAASFWVSLKPWDERDAKGLDMNHFIKRLEAQFSHITNAKIVVIPSPTLSGFGNSSGFSFILEQRSGEDLQQFDQVLHKFLAAANKRPEIGRAYDFYIPYSPQYHVEVDRDKCRLMGVQISDVFTALSTYMGGSFVNDFTRFEREFHVLIQADTAYRANISDLSQYYVKNAQGQMVPLSALVDVSKTGGPPVISHYNLYRSTEIDGNAAPGYSSGDAIKVLEQVAAQVLPSNFGYDFTNISLQEMEAGNKTILIFMLSILFVFLLLVALYESWSVPFSILLTVPVALFGAILALWLGRLQNSVYSQIGLICLIGLAAKNAILIVEYAKERVDRGVPLIQATLIATKLRFRPILMTSFAFIFGVLPLCLATGAGAASRLNIGFTVVGGMLVATLLGIFTVPTLYVLITRWSYGRKKLNKLALAQAGDMDGEVNNGDGVEEIKKPEKE